jgi:hypothetical protein
MRAFQIPHLFAAVLLLLAAAPATAQALRDALDAGDLICEVRHDLQHGFFADASPHTPAADLLLVYDSVGARAPHVVSSQRPGRHAVEVRVTASAVHLIEPVGPSLRQTALTRCLRSKWRNGYEICVRFAARHAWHFDAGVYGDPDAALARVSNNVSLGVCEPWSLD